MEKPVKVWKGSIKKDSKLKKRHNKPTDFRIFNGCMIVVRIIVI